MKHKKNDLRTDNVVNPPLFLLHYEFFCIAWDYKHEGFFLDPVEGYISEYKNPKDLNIRWNYYYSSEEYSNPLPWGYETDGIITKKNLLENINNFKKMAIEPKKNNINLNIIKQSLDEAGYDHQGEMYDFGVYSFSIYIYEPTKEAYRRHLIKSYGDKSLISKSPFTSELLSYFPNT